MRMFGGFASLSQLAFPTLTDPYTSAIIRNTRAYKNKLIKEHGDTKFTINEFKSTVKEILKDSPIIIHNSSTPKYKDVKSSRTLVLEISDTHYGANIDSKEMHGVNEYSWVTAARRTAYLIKQVVSYK